MGQGQSEVAVVKKQPTTKQDSSTIEFRLLITKLREKKNEDPRRNNPFFLDLLVDDMRTLIVSNLDDASRFCFSLTCYQSLIRYYDKNLFGDRFAAAAAREGHTNLLEYALVSRAPFPDNIYFEAVKKPERISLGLFEFAYKNLVSQSNTPAAKQAFGIYVATLPREQFHSITEWVHFGYLTADWTKLSRDFLQSLIKLGGVSFLRFLVSQQGSIYKPQHFTEAFQGIILSTCVYYRSDLATIRYIYGFQKSNIYIQNILDDFIHNIRHIINPIALLTEILAECSPSDFLHRVNPMIFQSINSEKYDLLKEVFSIIRRCDSGAVGKAADFAMTVAISEPNFTAVELVRPHFSSVAVTWDYVNDMIKEYKLLSRGRLASETEPLNTVSFALKSLSPVWWTALLDNNICDNAVRLNGDVIMPQIQIYRFKEVCLQIFHREPKIFEACIEAGIELPDGCVEKSLAKMAKLSQFITTENLSVLEALLKHQFVSKEKLLEIYVSNEADFPLSFFQESPMDRLLGLGDIYGPSVYKKFFNRTCFRRIVMYIDSKYRKSNIFEMLEVLVFLLKETKLVLDSDLLVCVKTLTRKHSQELILKAIAPFTTSHG